MSDVLHLLIPRDDLIECQTARAPDYYGLGVRLGIYFAWFSGYIANVALPAEIPGALDTNVIFLLTILVAMIKCTSTNMLAQIDGLILMHLAGGSIFGILSLWGYRTRQYHDDGHRAIRYFGGFGTHSRLIASLGVSIYGLWFWLIGVKGGLSAMDPEDAEVEQPNPPECENLYTFMFAKVRADGGVRIFYIIICIGCIAYFGLMLLVSTLAVWARARKMAWLAKQQRWTETSRLRYATGFNYRETDVIFKWLRVLNLLWLIFSMLLVEFTLNFNNVNAVLGGPHDNEVHLPAQLLPLMIGAFSFVRICYLTFESWRSPDDATPSIIQPGQPRDSRTMHFGVEVLQAFSPAMARSSTSKTHRPDEVDELEGRRSRGVRYLVAWMPWLSLLKQFQDQPVDERRKTIENGEYGKRQDERSTDRSRIARQSYGGSTVHDGDLGKD